MTEHEKDESTLPVQSAEPEIDAPEEIEEIVENKEVPKRRNNTLFNSILVIFILFLAMIGAGGYLFWQQYQIQTDAYSQQQQSFETRLEESQKQIKSLQQINDQSNSNWQKAVSDLEQLVVNSAQRLNREANRTENRWPLEEALTLARLAQQRLQLDSSASVALGLLNAADTILAGLDQAAVLPLRRQIAKDKLALETTKAADINGHYFLLEAIAGEIKELTWIAKPVTKTAIPDNASPVDGFWHGLKQIVVVTRLDVPMEAPALQSDFERWRQHQLLLIEQTQLALLAHNQPLFDAALEQTRSTLDSMVSQFSISVWQEQLAKLQNSVLNPAWPDINASVESIELYLSEQEESELEGAQ